MLRLTIALLLLTASPVLHAQPQTATAAEALFGDGKRLMEEGDYARACPKLAESQKLDPGTGTLLNLADCYEKDGRLASAWSTWLEAAASARSGNQEDRQALARERADALEPQLGRLTILVRVPEAERPSGLRIEMDEVALAPATMGTPIPADRGSHVIVVSAPGHHTFKGEVSVVDGKATTIEVPELPPLPPTPPSGDSATATKPAATTDAYGPPPGRAQRTWGYVSLGVGALGIAAGSILGVSAMQRKDESLTECDPVQTNRCNSIGSAIRADARTLGTASTIGFIAGGVLVATGVTLLLTAPKGTQVGFSAGPGLARLSFRTTF